MTPARERRFEGIQYPVALTENNERAFVVSKKGHLALLDNGGRRSGIERREFSYYAHAPERRSGLDRRKNGEDRRSGVGDRRGAMEVSVGDRREPGM